MMKVKLINSAGCELDTIKAPNNEKAFAKIAEQWLENLTKGDKIVILHADEDDEPAFDPENIYGLPGIRQSIEDDRT
jgi:endonuclease YncB( thermonuclease family)